MNIDDLIKAVMIFILSIIGAFFGEWLGSQEMMKDCEQKGHTFVVGGGPKIMCEVVKKQ